MANRDIKKKKKMVNITNYWGIQIKTTIRYHLTSDRVTITKKQTKNQQMTDVGENVGGKNKTKQKKTLLHCWWDSKLVKPLQENHMQVLKKLKI